MAEVKRDHSDKEGPLRNLAKLVEDCKEKTVFDSKPRGYLVFLLEKFLGHHSINAEIVSGMASFDPHILLSLPMGFIDQYSTKIWGLLTSFDKNMPP